MILEEKQKENKMSTIQFQLTGEVCSACYLGPLPRTEIELNLMLTTEPFSGPVFIPLYQTYYNRDVYKITDLVGTLNNQELSLNSAAAWISDVPSIYHVYLPFTVDNIQGLIWNDFGSDLI